MWKPINKERAWNMIGRAAYLYWDAPVKTLEPVEFENIEKKLRNLWLAFTASHKAIGTPEVLTTCLEPNSKVVKFEQPDIIWLIKFYRTGDVILRISGLVSPDRFTFQELVRIKGIVDFWDAIR